MRTARNRIPFLRMSLAAAAILLLSFPLSAQAPVGTCVATGFETVQTDQWDYDPGASVLVTGSGYPPNCDVLLRVTRPDGSIVIGDGSFLPGSDVVPTTPEGTFGYLYKLNGIKGFYVVEALGLDEQFLASVVFHDGANGWRAPFQVAQPWASEYSPPGYWTNKASALSQDGSGAGSGTSGREIGYREFNRRLPALWQPTPPPYIDIRPDIGSLDSTIPAGETPVGIEVNLQAYTNTTCAAGMHHLGVALSWDNGTSWTAFQTVAITKSSGAFFPHTLGGAADDWGRTWSVSELTNANFVTRLQYTRDASCSNGSVRLDVVAVQVHSELACITPTAYSITGGGAYCLEDGGVEVGLDDSEVGVEYQLQRDGVDVGSPVAGDGDAITFGTQSVAGDYTVVAKDAASTCTDEVTMTGSVTISVIHPPTLGLPSGGWTVQYSDDVVFSATLTDALLTDVPNTAGKVTFTIDAAVDIVVGPIDVVGGVATAPAEHIELAPGTYDVTVVFDPDSGCDPVTDTSKDLVVTREDATVVPDSDNKLAEPVDAPGGTASFIMEFTVSETNPEPNGDPPGVHPGDIANAGLTVHLVAVGSGANSRNVVCTSTYSAVDPLAYADQKFFTCTFSGVAVDAYEVQAEVTGYYTGTYYDVLTVYDPSAGGVTGGGKFIYPGSDDRVNFGLVYTYTGKGKTTPRGNLLVIRHRENGDVCRIKSNGIGAAAVVDPAASFSGKGNYGCTRPDGSTYDGAGNQSILGWMQDNGEPGASSALTPDRFWVRITAPDSRILMATPAPDNAAPLIGGNIQVPHVTQKSKR